MNGYITKYASEIPKQHGSSLTQHNDLLNINKEVENFRKTAIENYKKDEIEKYRKTANLFINNHLKLEKSRPLESNCIGDYKLINEHNLVNRRLVDNLFQNTTELLEQFSDPDLLFKLSLLFFYSNDPDHVDKARGLCARAICSQFQEVLDKDEMQIKFYIRLLTTCQKGQEKFFKTASALVQLITKPRKEIEKLKKEGIERTSLLEDKNSFLEHCESLFLALSSPNQSLLTKDADALYHSIDFFIRTYSTNYFMWPLSKKLYHIYGPQKLPPLIKFHYTNALIHKKDYTKAIEMLI